MMGGDETGKIPRSLTVGFQESKLETGAMIWRATKGVRLLASIGVVAGCAILGVISAIGLTYMGGPAPSYVPAIVMACLGAALVLLYGIIASRRAAESTRVDGDHPRRTFQFSLKSMLWLMTGASVCLAYGKYTDWNADFLCLPVLVGLGLAIIHSARELLAAVLLFLIRISIPVVLRSDVLLFLWTTRTDQRWNAAEWVFTAVMYLLIPTLSLLVDMTCARIWNRRTLVIRYYVEVFIVSPLWFMVMCVVDPIARRVS